MEYSEIRELEIEDELEEIEQAVEKYEFPTVYFCAPNIRFNIMCSDLPLWDTRRLKISVTNNYVVFRPAEKKDRRSFAVTRMGADTPHYSAHFPTNLQVKGIRQGCYRLYKYGDDAYAIKRYELLKEEAV